MAALKTCIAIPTEPWETAKLRFTADLSLEEQSLFATATVENLFYRASVTFKKHEEDDRVRRAQKKLKPLIDSIEGYGKAMDTIAQISPSILCPLWGSLRVVLQAAQKYGEYYDKLIDMFARISDNLPRFRVYEHLFPDHERLLAALAKAYLDIIKFSIDVIEVFLEVRKSSSLRRNPLKKRWKSLDDRFDTYLCGFRRHQDNISEEANLAQMIEIKKSKQLKRRRKILALLSPIDHRTKHERVQRLRYPGTGLWFTENTKFQTWLKEDKSGCFCCFGIPGSGKTVLASAVIDAVSPTFSDLTSVCCYYYCDYADQETLEFQNLLGSLTRQLLERIEIPKNIEKLLHRNLEYGFSLSLSQSQASLLNALSSFQKNFIVLDGIDEVSEDGQRYLVNMVQRLVSTLKPVVKILLSFRREEIWLRKALSLYPYVEISCRENGQDIARFVRATVELKISSGELIVRNSRLKEEIVVRLVEGAQGMFLWVKFQIDEICDTLTDEAIYAKLQDLPKDLAETYGRIVKKISDSPDGSAKIQLAKKIFQFIVCAKRPLTVDELKEAVAIQEGDRELKTDRIPSDDGSRMLQCCANLILFDRTDRTVRLAHHTVRQYLLRLPLNLQTGAEAQDELVTSFGPISDRSNNHDDFQGVHFKIEDSQKRVLELCITYLYFSDFEYQVIRAEDAVGAQLTISHEEAKTAILNSFSRPVTWLTSLIWGGSGHVSRDGRVVFTAPNPPSEAFIKRYMLLEYITAFWASHASDYLSPFYENGLISQIPMYGPLKDLVFHRQTPFNIKPWLADCFQSAYTPKELPFLSLFRWAIDQDFVAFLDMLQKPPSGSRIWEYYTYECEPSEVRIHPIRRTCRSDSSKVLRYFIYNGMFWGTLDHSLTAYSIIRAAPHEDCYLLSTLLRKTRLGKKEIQYELSEALCHHSKVGNSIAVCRLLKSGADPSLKGGVLPLDGDPQPNSPSTDKRWPLEWALIGRHEQVMQLLCIEPGPYKPALYMGIRKPLLFALEIGDSKTIEALLDISPNLSRSLERMELDQQVLGGACGHIIASRRLDIIEDLIRRGWLTATTLNLDLRGLWHSAARGGHRRLLRLLVEMDQPGINDLDSAGLTPLLSALQPPCHKNLAYIIRTLVDVPNIDLDARNSSGQSVRDLAKRQGLEHFLHRTADHGD